MFSKVKVLIATLVLLVGLPLVSYAETATISGRVTDSTGSAVPNAKVTAVAVATGATRTVETNSSGFYSLPSLTPGAYNVTVEHANFETFRFSQVTLTVQQSLTLNAQLQLGQVTATVEVSGAQVAPIDTTDAQISNVVESAQIQAMPLITRDPYSLVTLSPGVIQSNSSLGGFSVNGTSERNNNFLLDGVDNNDADVPGIPGGIVGIDPDSTQEFRVITNNFAPEFGRDNGAIIDIITRSGTNEFHGDAYWFGRYAALGARDYFNHDPGSTKNPYVRNQFGASAGGPIIKDRTFWFVNYEGQRFPTTLENSSIVPTAAFKTGVFTYTDPVTNAAVPIDVSTPSSPNNATGLPLDPVMQSILALYPDPTPGAPAVDSVRGTLYFPSTDNFTGDNFTIKIDHQLTSTNKFSARYVFNRGTDPNAGHYDFLPGGIGGYNTYQRTQSLALSLTSTIGSNMVNDLRFGFNRTHLSFDCNGVSLFNSFGQLDAFGRGADYSLPGISGFGCLVLGDSNGQARFTGTYDTSENFSLVHGSHTLKFGAEFRDVYSNSYDNFSTRTTLDFSGYSNTGLPGFSTGDPNVDGIATLQNMVLALYGFPDYQSQTQYFNTAGAPAATDLRGFRQREWGLYAQDTWKARHNLSVTYGLRWEYFGVPFEVNNLLSNLFTGASGPAPFTFDLVGPGTGKKLYNTEWKDFEPRIGIAWDPFGTGKTSVRAGYGIFHDRVFGNLFGNARGNPPFSQGFFAYNPVYFGGSFATLSSGLTPPSTLTASPTVDNGAGIFPIIMGPNFHTPYSQNWNVGIQRELPHSIVLDVNYVGVTGTHIIREVDGNPPQPNLVSDLVTYCSNPSNAYGCTPATLQFANLWFGQEFGVLPYDAVNNNAFYSAALQESIASSTYNGLQVNVRKQMSHGLQVQLAYTYSHAIDNASDPLAPTAGNRSFPRNSFNLKAERGNSNFDIRHRAVVNFIYQPQIGRGTAHLSEGLVGRALEGWELAGIVTMQTGLPYDVFSNQDNQHTGLSDRATITKGPNPSPYVSLPNFTGPKNYIFSFGTIGVPSNLGRNYFYGPGMDNWDLTLQKNTSITEQMKFQLRFEFYNMFNHVAFAQPDNLVADSTLGLSTAQLGRADGTTGAREIQIAARLSF